MSSYHVVTADPEGYWLLPENSRDPREWVWMEQADPVVEMKRLQGERVLLMTELEASQVVMNAAREFIAQSEKLSAMLSEVAP